MQVGFGVLGDGMKRLRVADIGGTKIALGEIGTDGTGATLFGSHPSDLLRVADPIGAMARLLQPKDGSDGVKAAVLGMPTSLDPRLDLVLSSPNIPHLEGLNFGSGLAERLGYPVWLERDIVLLLLGEVAALGGATSALGVFFGTGVGGAFLQDGQPYRGHRVGIEIGHIPIRGEGRRCVCGNLDCLEAYACGHTLNDYAARFQVPVAGLFTTRTMPELEQKLFEFVRDQAFALATAINLFDPEKVVIGGGVVQMAGYPKEQFLQLVQRHLRRPYPRESVQLHWASLGSKAALFGALEVVKQR
jgi:allose kinase